MRTNDKKCVYTGSYIKKKQICTVGNTGMLINSPTYQLSKHLCCLLSSLVGNSGSGVRILRQLVGFISDLCIQEDEIIASFDIVSLFMNVPRDLAIGVVSKRLSSDESLQDRTNLSVQSILLLLAVV